MEKPKIKKANKRALIILALLIAARVGLSAVFVMTAKAEINSNGFINYNGRSYSEAPSRLSYDVMIDYNGARKNRSRLYNGTAWDFSLNPIYMKFVSPLNPQLDKNSSFLITDIGESSQKIYIANDFVLPAVDYDTVIGIRGLNRHALKTLFSASSGVFLLAIRKYCCVEETPDYAKTKAFRVLCSFKTSYFCRYKEKNEAMLSHCKAF